MEDDVEVTDAEIAALHDGLERLSYYEFLGIRPGCDYVAVREAFYTRAQRFHPDRFLRVDDEDMRRAVYAVYKRIAEAYNVLIDPQLRVAYDEARSRGQSRLSDVARARRLSQEERQLSNPFARIYIRSARQKLERGEVVAAWIDAKLGQSLEDARLFRLLLQHIEDGPGRELLGGEPRS